MESADFFALAGGRRFCYGPRAGLNLVPRGDRALQPTEPPSRRMDTGMLTHGRPASPVAIGLSKFANILMPKAAMFRITTLLLAVCTLCSGCADGPFYALKRANPYFQREFRRDRQLGPTFEDRLAELELLNKQLPAMDPTRRAEWSNHLEQIILNDPSSELRSRATLAIATIPTEAATRALNGASADDVEKVRLAACKAWKNRQGPAARDMLLSLAAKQDETPSVRQAAIEALGAFDESEVRATLTDLLDDRSPAIQYQVTQSLKELTGRDYGGDFESWKLYMAGQDVPEPAPKSFTATIWEALPTAW